MENNDEYINLDRKSEEPIIKYQERLNQYCAGIIGLIESYGKEANIQRFRELLPLTRELLEGENSEAVEKVVRLIKKLREEIKWYDARYGPILGGTNLKEKKKNLDSLLS
ncbi:MAG: hypothetical protein ABH804_01305 [archaeon]